MGRFVSAFVGKLEDFGKEFKGNDSEKHSGGKGHDEMEPVFKTEGNETSNKNRSESGEGE